MNSRSKRGSRSQHSDAQLERSSNGQRAGKRSRTGRGRDSRLDSDERTFSSDRRGRDARNKRAYGSERSYGDVDDRRSSAQRGSGRGRSDERRSYSRREQQGPSADYKSKGAKRRDSREMPEDRLYGRNPILEALAAGQTIDKLWVLRHGEQGRDPRLKQLVQACKEAGAVIMEIERRAMDRLADGFPHQGCIAQTAVKSYLELDTYLSNRESQAPDLILIADKIQDPHNLGAMIRVADTAGASAVIIPKHESAGLNATVAKASAGASAYVPVIRENNLSQTLKRLKDAGFWILSCDMSGEDLYDSEALKPLLTAPLALIIGNEGKGISENLRRLSDLCLRIPMLGEISSLNASVSAAIVAYEILRRRRQELPMT